MLVICFRPLSSAALSVIALRRLSHYFSPCGLLAHLCTLVCNNQKKKRKTVSRGLLAESASISVTLSPFANVIGALSRWGTALNHMYIKLTHEKPSYFRARHAVGWGTWLFTITFNSLWIYKLIFKHCTHSVTIRKTKQNKTKRCIAGIEIPVTRLNIMRLAFWIYQIRHVSVDLRL